MAGSLIGQVALITGASGGIGYEAALAFTRAGVHVIACARRRERLEELARAVADLPLPHGEILIVEADVRDSAALQKAVADGVDRFGRLDIVVANAGIGHRGPIVDSDWADLDTLIRINIDGVLHTIRAGVPAVRAGGRGGAVLIVSSVVANMTAPYAAAYSASKAFVSSIARSLRLELEADRIRVVDLLVGRTATEFSENRLGVPGHAARAPRLPVMPASYVAARMVEAVACGTNGALALRWFDRLIVWANALIPGVIGRRALQQYRTDDRR